MMEKKKITLTGVNETLFVPLYARALESRKPDHAFYDATAVRVVESVDYDFAKHGKNKMNMWGCAARTVIFDRQVKEHIKRYPDCSVVNLACGVDDRFSRVDNGKIHWYNIDLPEVIKLRKEIMEPNPRVMEIPCSAFDYRWMNQIENKEHTLFVAEGFLMYVTEKQAEDLFDAVSAQFEHSVLLLELMHTWMVKHQKLHDTTKLTDVVFRWGVGAAEDFVKLCPQYRFIGEYNFTDEMKQFSPVFMTLAAPFLRGKNNRMGRFEQID